MIINVTVSDLDLKTVIDDDYDDGRVTLADKVAEAIVARVVNDTGAWNSIAARVRDLRDEEVRVQVAPLVAAAIAGPVQRTNDFGEPVGPPKALRDLIVEQVQQQLRKPADQYHTGGPRETWVEKLVREQVEKALREELSATIKVEKDRIVALVRAKAADIMARSLTEGIGR